MARRAALTFETMERGRRLGCKRITFKRARRGGKILPKSRWISVIRCEGRRLRATNKRQCKNRKGLYVRCAAGRRGGRRRSRR
jgi:hypothetical protein